MQRARYMRSWLAERCLYPPSTCPSNVSMPAARRQVDSAAICAPPDGPLPRRLLPQYTHWPRNFATVSRSAPCLTPTKTASATASFTCRCPPVRGSAFRSRWRGTKPEPARPSSPAQRNNLRRGHVPRGALRSLGLWSVAASRLRYWPAVGPRRKNGGCKGSQGAEGRDPPEVPLYLAEAKRLGSPHQRMRRLHADRAMLCAILLRKQPAHALGVSRVCMRVGGEGPCKFDLFDDSGAVKAPRCNSSAHVSHICCF
jgi:hypothetical protein